MPRFSPNSPEFGYSSVPTTAAPATADRTASPPRPPPRARAAPMRSAAKVRKATTSPARSVSGPPPVRTTPHSGTSVPLVFSSPTPQVLWLPTVAQASRLCSLSPRHRRSDSPQWHKRPACVLFPHATGALAPHSGTSVPLVFSFPTPQALWLPTVAQASRLCSLSPRHRRSGSPQWHKRPACVLFPHATGALAPHSGTSVPLVFSFPTPQAL